MCAHGDLLLQQLIFLLQLLDPPVLDLQLLAVLLQHRFEPVIDGLEVSPCLALLGERVCICDCHRDVIGMGDEVGEVEGFKIFVVGVLDGGVAGDVGAAVFLGGLDALL